MTKSVATQLAVFAGLMFIVFGLKAGFSEHYLAPTGITENAYSSERQDEGESSVATDLDLLGCGSAWSPYEAAPSSDDPAAEESDSQLSEFGEDRCEAQLAGIGWSAALLVLTGVGVWLILVVNAVDRMLTARRQAEDDEYHRLIEQKRSDTERQRRDVDVTTD